MKIINTTKWSTDDLRKIFSKVKHDVDKWEGRPIKRLKVYVKNKTYASSISGIAFIGYGQMSIFISKVDFNDIEIRKRLAKVFMHEYYHNLGVKSIDYRNYKSDFTRYADYTWVKDFNIRETEIKPEEKVDIKANRYELALKNLKSATTRLKRAKTLFNKWSSKIKYYEQAYQFASKVKKEK